MAQHTDAESLFDSVRVSRETRDRLEAFVALLLKWQAKINLISPATADAVWTRHVADSAQLVDLAPEKISTWVDLGSGGGFPGIVVAILLAEREPGAVVHMVESDTRKCAFLHAACAETGVAARIHAMRIEKAAAKIAPKADVISARALAPLPRLLDLIWPYWSTGCVGLLPKGRDVESELTEAAKYWKLLSRLHPSTTAADGVILEIQELSRVAD